MSSRYLTLAAPGEAKVREKMSTFIAFAFAVSDAAEASARIGRIASEYHDARHVCWAYVLGTAGDITQCNDNGEPSGTAGRPILGQIRSAGLTYCAVAVVRYFGGIKLGTSGLIAAYREAARLALEAAPRLEAFETCDISFRFPYIAMNDVMRLIKDTPEAETVDRQFDNSCSMTLRVRTDCADRLRDRLTDLDGVTLS